MTSWHSCWSIHRLGATIVFFFSRLGTRKSVIEKSSVSDGKSMFFGAHWSGFSWFMLVRNTPSLSDTNLWNVSHTHTHISRVSRPKFSNPGGRDLVPRSSLICKWWLGDSIHQLLKSFGRFTQKRPKTDECFMPPQLVDGKKRQNFLVPGGHILSGFTWFYHRYPQSCPRILRRNGHTLDRPGCYRWQILLQAQCYSS